MSRFDPWYVWIAQGFGLGRLPLIPGTWGSLGALLLYVGVFFSAPDRYLQGMVVVALLSCVPLSDWTARYLGESDPRSVVIDEFVGQWLSLWPTYWMAWWPQPWLGFVVGFFLFRYLDIVKPFGIDRLQGYPRGWGIVLDDCAAGLATNVCLTLVGYFVLS